MTGTPLTTYHCLIGDADGRLLLMPAEGRGWALPTVSQPSQNWFPYDVAAVQRLVGERYGLDATVLRHLRDAETDQVCELRLQANSGERPEGSRWVDRRGLAALTLAPREQRELLDRWLLEQESGYVPDVRSPWERAGWLAEATAWIEAEVGRLNASVSGPIEPVKLAWSGSAVLRLETTEGRLYFKAVGRKPPSEVAMIQALAERYPASVPRIVAHDRERRWMLTKDFGGRLLDELPLLWWTGAVRRLAEIQLEGSVDPGGWFDLGCPDRTPAAMPALWRLMLADAAPHTPPADGLEPAEIERLRAMTPRLEAMWDRLAACGIPSSLLLEDFRGSNVAVAGSTHIFLDLSDCVVGQPFFSVQRMLHLLAPPAGAVGRANPAGGPRRRIRDAYLAPWKAAYPPARVDEAFGLAGHLYCAYQAVRGFSALADIEPGSPWYLRVVRANAWNLRTLIDLDPPA